LRTFLEEKYGFLTRDFSKREVSFQDGFWTPTRPSLLQRGGRSGRAFEKVAWLPKEEVYDLVKKTFHRTFLLFLT